MALSGVRVVEAHFCPKHILVPVAIDPDEDFRIAKYAVLAACDLATQFNAKITILNLASMPIPGDVVDLDFSGEAYRSLLDVLEAKMDRGKLKVEELKELAKSRGVEVQGRVVDHVDKTAQVIADTANDLAMDLIVLASHGRRGLSHLLMGSIAEEVVRLSTVAVLILHPKNN